MQSYVGIVTSASRTRRETRTLFQASAMTAAFDEASDTNTSALFPWSRMYHFWILEAGVELSTLEIVEQTFVGAPMQGAPAETRELGLEEKQDFLSGVKVMKPSAIPRARKYTAMDTSIVLSFR